VSHQTQSIPVQRERVIARSLRAFTHGIYICWYNQKKNCLKKPKKVEKKLVQSSSFTKPSFNIPNSNIPRIDHALQTAWNSETTTVPIKKSSRTQHKKISKQKKTNILHTSLQQYLAENKPKNLTPKTQTPNFQLLNPLLIQNSIIFFEK